MIIKKMQHETTHGGLVNSSVWMDPKLWYAFKAYCNENKVSCMEVGGELLSEQIRKLLKNEKGGKNA